MEHRIAVLLDETVFDVTLVFEHEGRLCSNDQT